MSNVRTLSRLIDRLEEFMDEFKTMLEADEMSTVDDVVSIVDRVRNELEENEENEDD
jgi:DNA integrity scanning protein DisA with diadenylate cyclase activity